MKLHQQYLLLHNRFGDMSEHEATLSELAELLDCTHRNTLTIVKNGGLRLDSLDLPAWPRSQVNTHAARTCRTDRSGIYDASPQSPGIASSR